MMDFWESVVVLAKGFIGVGWMSVSFGFKEVHPRPVSADTFSINSTRAHTFYRFPLCRPI